MGEALPEPTKTYFFCSVRIHSISDVGVCYKNLKEVGFGRSRYATILNQIRKNKTTHTTPKTLELRTHLSVGSHFLHGPDKTMQIKGDYGKP